MDKYKYYNFSEPITLRKESFGGLLYIPSISHTFELTDEAYALLSTLYYTRLIDAADKIGIPFIEAIGIIREINEYGQFLVPTDTPIPFLGRIINLPEPKDGYLSSPLQVGIELGRSCNLCCKYCYSSATRNSLEFIKIDHLIPILDQLSGIGVISIYFSGGEPFLHPSVLEILTYAARQNSYDILISTNGYCARRPEVLESLQDYKSKIGFQVSLDSMDIETNDNIRGPQSYILATSAIHVLVKLGFSVGLGCVVTEFTIAGIDDLISFAKASGCDEVHLMGIMPSGQARPVFNNLRPNINKLLKFEKKIRQLAKDSTISIAWGNGLFLPPSSFEPSKLTEVDRRFVGNQSGVTKCYIDSQLNVFPDDLLIAEEMRAGSLLDELLLIIWQESEIFQRIRHEENKHPECLKCKFYMGCQGGDIALNFWLVNDIKTKNPLCPHSPLENYYVALHENERR